MTLNLRKFVEFFDYFREETAWYLKIGVGVVLGVILASGLWILFKPEAPPAQAAVVPPTVTPTQVPTPTWTPVPTQTPLPTSPTPFPVVHLVWSKQAEKVNLRDAPAGYVTSAVANGQSVVVSNEVEKSGGYTWIKVAFGDKEGWMADFLIWEMEGKYQLLESARDYYDAQNGAYAGSLPKGTAYKILSEEEGWTQILLPDEQAVWVEK